MKKFSLLLCIAFIAIFSFLVYSCTKEKSSSGRLPPQTLLSARAYDTITTLAAFKKDTVIWKHGGIFTMVTYEENHDEENEINERSSGTASTTTCFDAFAGSARSAAKTSYASVSYGTYASINAMRAVLQTDSYMKGLGITNSSPRVSEENRNRSITTSYLYAIARESDNDFHMIIGDANNAAGNLLNCEASGNPASGQSSYAAINAVRTYLKGYFGKDFCGQSGYTKFSPAIRISVLKGSLFFDIDHAAGTIGPLGLRPNTAWEMHPVHNITF